jgi:long-subunit acyl-CoA synthetase (AMP-forming)
MCRSQFIAQALLYGDNQRHCVALVVPDFVEIKAWMLKNNKGNRDKYIHVYM